MRSFSPLAAAVLIVPGAAFAAEGQAKPSEIVFVCQIVALLLTGRVLGELMQRVGQPAVMGQLLAGVLLGPSIFGALLPEAHTWLFPSMPEQKAMLEAVSALGILLLLLLTGMETDIAMVRGQTRAALGVSLAGIAVPFACGFALGEMLPDSMIGDPAKRLVTSLFLGTALSISSVKIVAMVVRDMGFARRKVGQLIMASAIIDDTLGWIIISMTFSIALHGGLDVMALAKSLIGTALFIGLSFTLGRRLVFHAIRWTNDTFVSEVPVITAIIIIMCLMAVITDAIGVHTVLGAFMAGMLVGQSPILTKHIEGELRGLITALFMPVFFGMAGLSADFSILKSPWLAGLTVALVAVASVGKFSGAFLGGWAGGLSLRESLALGCGMNARGSTEVVVASIGLSMGALSQDLYTMIVMMAVTTTLAMPPMLRAALRRVPMHADERERLDREEAEKSAFLPTLERLLVVTDHSLKASFASRLAALLTVPRGIPVTIMPAPDTAPASSALPAPSVDAIQLAANQAKRDEDMPLPLADDLILLVKEPGEAKVGDEVKKGYGLTLVGLDTVIASEGGLHPRIVDIAKDVDGAIAICATRQQHALDPLGTKLNILVPINDSDAARKGAEIAFAIAAAAGDSANVLVLHVAGDRDLQRNAARQREAVLRDISAMADRMKIEIRTAVRLNLTAEDAILRQVRLGGHNLIVLGVSRRTGETFAFSKVAESVLEASGRSVLAIAF